MYFIFYVLVGVLALLVAEKILLQQHVRRIVWRIHINGSRGKSSVTRYIAAGMRARKIKTLAKITGVLPTLILSDGTLKTIKRKGAARVQEQLRLMHFAARNNYNAFVLECMSIKPEFQKLELQSYKPQIYVLTNILDDHREVLGSTPRERTAVYGNLLPVNTKVVMPKSTYTKEMENWVRAKNCQTILARPVSAKIPDGAFAENIALALAVCKQAGVPEKIALPAILREAQTDNQNVIPFGAAADACTFINGFAVNDVESAKKLIKKWQKTYPEQTNTVFIFNSRSDRAVRSRLFTDWFLSLKTPLQIILTGDHRPYVRRRLLLKKWPKERLIVWKQEDVAQASIRLREYGFKQTLVFGLGNIQGEGFKILEQIKRLAEQ